MRLRREGLLADAIIPHHTEPSSRVTPSLTMLDQVTDLTVRISRHSRLCCRPCQRLRPRHCGQSQCLSRSPRTPRHWRVSWLSSSPGGTEALLSEVTYPGWPAF